MRWWAILLTVLSVASGAHGQESLMRDEIGAAYCIGVLDFFIANKMPPTKCPEGLAASECESLRNSTILRDNNNVFMRERYRQFIVARRTVNRGGELVTATQTLGRRDAKECSDLGFAWLSHWDNVCATACRGNYYAESCRYCMRMNEPASCHTTKQCTDPSRLPF